MVWFGYIARLSSDEEGGNLTNFLPSLRLEEGGGVREPCGVSAIFYRFHIKKVKKGSSKAYQNDRQLRYF
jgi:hypothetical protein